MVPASCHVRRSRTRLMYRALWFYYTLQDSAAAPRRETRRRPLEATCALEVDATCAREEEDTCAGEVVRLEGLQEEVAKLNDPRPRRPAASRPPRPRCRCGGTRCPWRRRRRAHSSKRAWGRRPGRENRPSHAAGSPGLPVKPCKRPNMGGGGGADLDGQDAHLRVGNGASAPLRSGHRADAASARRGAATSVK